MLPGKWGLHTFYMKDNVIRAYLPDTRQFNQLTLKHLLGKYQSVYIKPNMSHAGKGIKKAWKSKDGYRLVKVKGKYKTFRTVQKLYKTIRKNTRSEAYIIQQSIDLAELKSRPFDIRVMMMRNSQNRWSFMGMLAKVAGKSSVITNVNRGGGYVISVDQALSDSLELKTMEKRKITQKLIRLSYRICNRFIHYKYSSQIGIDFAIDKNKRLWVIEVNFDYPSHLLFSKLKDQTIYRKIKTVSRSYNNALRAGKFKRK
ncbi:YheC/YheD family protein [Paenibacillus planticolens]|uniref:YheC/YheD family protein n=1 Tax=Paenibacillus planticolens TaxID=2654976 RepID=A0ABX1ZQH9_9BACL|nr:YheC/YheD family protein [Paenibacillus planticolens]NOV02335.1 YheC/YheD family protein [Paenibacillus planticolens]